MWTLLEMFGYARLEDLNGYLIHRLENVLTLSREIHDSMKKLELWFEYTVCQFYWHHEIPTEHQYSQGVADKYKVCMTDPGITFLDIPDYVTFRNEALDFSTRRKDILNPFPLPNHKYLDLHALCCRVARMSGGADLVDEIERDLEETMVLSNDGADAHLLDYKLVGLAAQSGIASPVRQ